MEERKYPITFDQCPNCGSKRRVANEVIQEQKDLGRAGENTKAWLFQHQSMIADMSRTHLQMPVVMSYYDVCVDCGTTYCIRVEKGMVTPKTKMPPAGTGFGRN